MESKRNETFGNVIFSPNTTQGTWSARKGINEEATRQGGTPYPWARPHPRGPLVAPLTDFFRLYILLYPKTSRTSHENTFPPPQPFVTVRSHLGTFSGVLSEGDSIMEGFYINSIALPMECE